MGKVKVGLDKKIQKVLKTPASFGLFVAIHDFIKYIELNPALSAIVLSNAKANKELKIPDKYINLKRIYQGLEDANTKSNVDLGHTRYAVIVELNRIRNNDVSDTNSFWKRRELFRGLAGEIYQRLSPDSVLV
ncbi:MAG: hypothetical protein AAB885_02270 [Patescibacteria group bacterium]